MARDALNLLTDQLIDEIADMAIRQSEQDLINDTHIPQLTAQLSEVEKSIMNITAAIEKGIASETLMNRLVQLEHEKKTLNKEIKAEEKFVYRIDRDQIIFWLSQFKYGNIEDEDFRRRLIDLLVNSVTVWDEPDGYKITTAYNLTSCKTKTFRVDKNPAAEEATGFDFGESECTTANLLISMGSRFLFYLRISFIHLFSNVFLTSFIQAFCQLICKALLSGGIQMPVDIGSRLNVAVSHPFLYVFQAATVIQQQTGATMTEFMESNVWHSIPFKHF